MKLGLGTAQFGLDYGLSNRAGQVPEAEVARILAVAEGAGMRVLDTAAAYGTSEEVLGRVLPPGHGFSIVTKTPPLDKPRITEADAEYVVASCHASCRRLGRDTLSGVLVHHAPDVLVDGGHLIVEALADLKRAGTIEKFGVSVYTPDQVDRLLDLYPLDLIQVPLNVLDQRLVAGGQLARLKRNGVEVHARSAFLQGVLLMDPLQLPPHFDSVREHLLAYRRWADEQGLTPVAAALSFLTQQEEVDHVIVGVTTAAELLELTGSGRDGRFDFAPFAWSDEAILHPANWAVPVGVSAASLKGRP